MRNALLGLLVIAVAPLLAHADAPKKKIVLIGMKRDHGPGEHEYMAGLAILSECLKQTPGVEVASLRVNYDDKGWSADPKELDDARAIVCFLRAGGGYLLRDKERKAKIEQLMNKGAGFVALHWAVEGPKEFGDPYMAILGGYYEPGYSKNPINKVTVRPATKEHPIARGWKPFEARDEFYYDIRLLDEAKPAIVAKLGGKNDMPIGWTYERKTGKGELGPGRSFGFTGCHFHSNFGLPEFRRLIVNGILWTADVEVPPEGAPVKLGKPVPKIPDAEKTN